MSISDNGIFKLVFKTSAIIIAIQNVILLLWLTFSSSEGNEALAETLTPIAFTADLIGFGLLAFIALFATLADNEGRLKWLLVSIGASLFVFASVAWRAFLDIIPQNSLTEIPINILFQDMGGEILSLEDLIQQFFDYVGMILNAIIIANIGLLILSFGLGLRINKYRVLIVLYGLANVVGSIYWPFIIVKIFVAAPIAILYFVHMASHDIGDYL